MATNTTITSNVGGATTTVLPKKRGGAYVCGTVLLFRKKEIQKYPKYYSNPCKIRNVARSEREYRKMERRRQTEKIIKTPPSGLKSSLYIQQKREFGGGGKEKGRGQKLQTLERKMKGKSYILVKKRGGA